MTWCLHHYLKDHSLLVVEFSVTVHTLFSHPSLHPALHPSALNVPTQPMLEFFSISLVPLFSIALSPLSLLFLLLSPQICLNYPPGGNRSPPQSGTNCFVRFMNPEPNPDKRTLVRTALLFVFAGVTDCAVIKVFIVPLRCSYVWERAWSLTAHQSCHKYGAGAKLQKMLRAQMK